MKYGVFLLGIAVAFVLGLVLGPTPGYETRIELRTNYVIQHTTETKHVPVYYTNTKRIIYTNYIYVTGELNQYRTNDGWIALSNHRIHAGLYLRHWSVPYEIKTKKYKHNIGMLLGNGIQIQYGYQILRRWQVKGSVYSIQDKQGFLVGGEFKF